MNVTFLLPARGRSGGIRVTVEMANKLLARGYTVRVAYHDETNILSFQGLKSLVRDVVIGAIAGKNSDFIHEFKGKVEAFKSLEDLSYERGEILIAVGVYFIPQLLALKADVIKLRYDHGLPGDVNDPLYEHLRMPIDTICVSEGIVPIVERELGRKVLGVVPNGIDTDQYYLEPGPTKDGIGTIWATQYEKAPEETMELLQAIKRELPGTPLRVFGRPNRPQGLSPKEYARFPSIDQSRRLYNSCMLWLITSRSEGFSLPTLEAMACGAVVISSNHMNASKLIDDGLNGFIVPFGDTEGFIAKIKEVRADEALRIRISEKARETVQQYSWDRSADKMETVLKKLVEDYAARLA